MCYLSDYPRWVLITLIAASASGCATHASLTIISQPEGAFITEKETGKAWGTAPASVLYDSASLTQHRAADGCYLVKGFEARWVSGTAASLDLIRLCGSSSGSYNIVFSRDPTQPDLEKDLQFGLQLQALRAQQQQANAAQDAAAAALFSAWSNALRPSVTCTSVQIGNIIRTTCR